jgi:hypothetical protein
VNIPTPIRTIAVVVATIGTLVVLVGPAQASSSRPAGMSKAEYRALMLRSQALNEKYGLGASAAKPAAMTWPEYRALMLRSQALIEKYGLGGSHATVSSRPAVTIAQGGFAWSDFGLGAAAMLGLVLLTCGLVAGSRYGRRIPRTRISS